MPLKRTLGLPALIFYGVGIILGAGIYSVLGVAAEQAKETLWLSFTISSLIALLTAFSYAELATAYPRASAEFNYLRRAFPRLPGIALVVGLMVALSGSATASTVAIAFAGYLGNFVDVPTLLTAWLLIAAATILNIIGVKESAWVNALFTLLEAGGLILFIVVSTRSPQLLEAFSFKFHFGVITGAALVFFSFLGFENIANLAEEAKQPQRDLPRAIFLSLGIATLLYILVAFAAVALIPVDQLAQSEAPLAEAAATQSRTIAGALGGIALFATANTALVSILVASRVIFGIARAQELPKILARTLPGRKTPWSATLAVAAVAALLILFRQVDVVASLSSFASLLAFASVNIALILLRYREPEQNRPFRVPVAIGRFPLLPALGVVATLGIATQLASKALISGTIALVLCTGYALWWQRKKSRS